MNKHTPAPWKVNNRFFVTAKVGNREKSVVAEIDRHAWTQAGEAEANARLIAAAPELLEALKILLDAESRGYDTIAANVARKTARAAITKAQG